MSLNFKMKCKIDTNLAGTRRSPVFGSSLVCKLHRGYDERPTRKIHRSEFELLSSSDHPNTVTKVNYI